MTILETFAPGVTGASGASSAEAVRTHRRPPGMTVVGAGVQTTVQDVRGRRGLWHVGVPPSGAFDALSADLGRIAVGNPMSAAGLEFVARGPRLSFDRRVLICLTGAATQASLDDVPVQPGRVVVVRPGQILDTGPISGPGLRGYLAVSGGLDVAVVLGSRATFILGGFGGLAGRPLRDGDELALGAADNLSAPCDVQSLLPELSSGWTIRVVAGPHGAPSHLTEAGFHELFSTGWLVDHRADRTGIRLAGPTPGFSRTDGGEAGIHPSNVHDSAYPVGGMMLSGDTPVIVGVDGPSLGGFVVPAAVVGADLWMLGQLRPGDTVRLEPVALELAAEAMAARRAVLAEPQVEVGQRFHRGLGRLGAVQPAEPDASRSTPAEAAAVSSTPAEPRAAASVPVTKSTERQRTARPSALVRHGRAGHAPPFTIRPSGDRHLLVEAGLTELDLTVRVWIHLLAEGLRAQTLPGVTEVVEGVRSLLVGLDDELTSLHAVADLLGGIAGDLDDPAAVTLAVREVSLPIAFDHPEAHLAMRRYASVRPDAPWSPDNVEFIRRVNDLDARDDVFDIVARASYLVVGLGDVYLGAPVAVPIDPRDRLVTTKYNPARTWTPQNAVGIGGIYLCVYGMEGPGGYQLVGRTVPVWRLSERDAQPWLLRPFDRLRFRPVSADELARQRADIKAGRADLETRPATFSVTEVADLERTHRDEIAVLRARRRSAFDAERRRWN
jgi:urea carboxylase